MKRPKTINKNCKFCRQYVVMKVIDVKKKKASELSRGQRKFREATSGFGGFPRPKPTPKIKNPIRRINLKYTCSNCGKSVHPGGIKAKRFVRG